MEPSHPRSDAATIHVAAATPKPDPTARQALVILAIAAKLVNIRRLVEFR